MRYLIQKMKYFILFLLTVTLFQANIYSGELDTLTINKALVLKTPDKSRNSILPIDPIEAQIVLSKWSAPKEGDRVKFNKEDVGVWESMTADSNGWFRDGSLQGGYAYVSITLNQPQVFILEGIAHEMAYVNGKPHAGNRYQMKEQWEAWEPKFNYSLLPIELQAGTNDLLFQCTRGMLKVKLLKPKAGVFFNANDITTPDLIVGEEVDTWGAIVIINASALALERYHIASSYEADSQVMTEVPRILPFTIRKVKFQLKGSAPKEKGAVEIELQLLKNDQNETKLIDKTKISLRSVYPNEGHKRTFISNIDESLQHYAINPASDADDKPKALFLSVHGAGVEAMNQANSYYPKSWGHVVAPTNRRPYGFNWEDWGRLDALEVLDIVEKELNIDPDRIYLTGHSMGGHGAWHLGAIFPDRFAAIGPSAGWISFWSYRIRQKLGDSPIEQMLMRATLPSNTIAMANNYKGQGVYIIHGKDDDNVPVEQSRQMVDHLSKFHKDFIYNEQPGVGHWWDISDEPGTDCVDWAPLFDFFARHVRPGKSRIRQVEFVTANPGISSSCYWVTIEHQIEQLKLSSVNIRFDPGKARFVGSTENVARLSFDLAALQPLDSIAVELDSQKITQIPCSKSIKKIELKREQDKWPEAKSQMPIANRVWLERKKDKWVVIDPPALSLKGPHRYGTFKDAFKNRVIFVYGTKGMPEENKWAVSKARYDAEQFWYQGNGSIDIIADVDFDPVQDKDRNVILYGNKKTNLAWEALLGDGPVQVNKGYIKIGDRKISGNDLACLFIRPRRGSDIASVGVVSGTGVVGMRLTDRRPYLSPGFAYPDCIVFNAKMLTEGIKGIRIAGFFGVDWSMDSGELVWNE